jgi:hypothetical protein
VAAGPNSVAATGRGFISAGSHDGQPAVWTTATGPAGFTAALPAQQPLTVTLPARQPPELYLKGVLTGSGPPCSRGER